jgi:polyisoprenoid-binding protein YceI
MYRRISFLGSLLVIASLVAACSGGSASPTSAPAQSTAASGATTPLPAGAFRLNLVADGTQARYRVREQLAQLSFPSDAIGKTSAVTGALAVNSDGTLVAGQSKFVVDLTTLQSDRSQRDHFVQGMLLETGQYPTAEFDAATVTGLPSPLPSSGAVNFQLAGNLIVHGVTRPTTWGVSSQIISSGQALTGTATTSFKFEDFNISQPHVSVVLSVDDKITLELDFHLVKAS